MEAHMNNENVFVSLINTSKDEIYDERVYNSSKGAANKIYYGVHVPPDGQVHEGAGGVFTDKIEALQLVKKNKKARFKAFYYYHEAEEFASQGAEFYSNSSLSNSTSKKSPDISPMVERNQFRGPKSQDLVKFRKGIESGNFKFVEDTIWDNPRYLISSGDTPSILQEGFRYNALHVASKAKNADITELILSTIINLDFIELLYGDEHQNSEERAAVLLDLYLNTPDKGLNETPLHFAVKFGAVKVVEVLVSFPQCDKKVKNKYGKLPNQIICDRCEGCNVEKVKKDIAMLLEENYYVPVLRSEDYCNPPIVGEPFSPTSPPNFNTNPMQPRVEIHAYAGPMDKKRADIFRKIWKTPPRILSFGSPIKSDSPPPNSTADKLVSLKLKDREKGLETFGRDLAIQYETNWKEFWPFLGSFIDLSSTEGLQQLETYLESRNRTDLYSSFHFQDSTNSKQSLQETNQKPDNSIQSPMSRLCEAMQLCNLSDNDCSGSMCKSRLTDNFNDGASDISLLNAELCPFSCVEKACQVFAYRIAIDILQFRETDKDAIKVLEKQMKYLELLMLSYLSDDRFKDVKIHSVHARLGSLILNKLSESENNMNYIKILIEKIQESCNKCYDGFSSDDESGEYCAKVTERNSASSNKQLLCVLGFVTSALINVTDIEDCSIDSDYKKIWEVCVECTCSNWQKITSRKSLRVKKSNQKIKPTFQRAYENVSRRLSYENEDLDAQRNVSSESENDLLSSDEEFYTPPSSPLLVNDSAGEEQYHETEVPECDIFIQSNKPSKTDHDVFKALKYARNKLNPKEYPYIYKWYHTVSLYSEREQKRWTAFKTEKSVPDSPNITSTPYRNMHNTEENHSHTTYASPKSWFRITGANSPRTSLQPYRTNISYNL